MDVSVRSVLTAGAGMLTATAVVMAPVINPVSVTPPPPQAHARLALPTQLAADVTPITQEALQAVVNLVNSIAPGLHVPAAPALEAAPAPLNAASDVINSVYSFSRYWANYVSLDLTPWVLQFIPFGWVATDQINIWYQPFVLRTTDSFVYEFLDPIVNNPLNLGVWINAGIALANDAISGFVNGVIGEINYLFGWILPPLPPLPNVASDVTVQTLASSTDVAAVPALAKASLAPPAETTDTVVDTVDAAAEGDTAAADVTAPAADVTEAAATTEPAVDPEATDTDITEAPTVEQAGDPAPAATPTADEGTPSDPAPAGTTAETGGDETDTDKPADKSEKPEKPAKSDKSDGGKPAKRGANAKDTATAGAPSAKAHAHQKADTDSTADKHQKADSGG